MHIPKAVCGECGSELAIDKTGICLEMFAEWGSYYKIYGDRYACINCGSSVILPSEQPVAMHFEPAYARFQADFPGRFIN